jgi:ABC-type iron transport system FetAB ATPase subunit
MKVSDIVYPDMNMARSTNLERDHNSADLVKNYQITGKAAEILGRFADALEGEKASAWSVTGPYGMGKSTFANYLAVLTGPANEPLTAMALEKLNGSHPELHARISNSMNEIDAKGGVLRLVVTAAYEPVNSTLARGLRSVLANLDLPGVQQYVELLNDLVTSKRIDSDELIAVLKGIKQLVDSPMVVIIDEFGKCLDYMAHHPDEGDIFIIQQLAEMDSVYLWVFLHQAFDDYAFGLSTLQKQEWAKIQGRFEDVSYVESTSQLLYMMQKVLKQSEDEQVKKRIEHWAVSVEQVIKRDFMQIAQHFTGDTIAGMYPLHPLTAITLVELCSKYAQNDRTLLAFMCSGHLHALPNYLDSTEISNEGWLPSVGLDYIYDYFFGMASTTYGGRSESQRWLEIHDIITSSSHLSSDEYDLLKTVGVLNLLSGTLGVKASLETICAIMEYSHGLDRETVKNLIDGFLMNRILLYREYADEYRLWEGSDFDIHEALRKKKEQLTVGSLDVILEKYVPLSPLIASRHSYKTGTTRRFERRWVDAELLTDDIEPNEWLDGLIVYSFGTTSELSCVPTKCKDGRPLLVAYVRSRRIIYELALDLAAARSVLDESPELEHDSVARREVKARIGMAEQEFHERLERLYSPGSVDTLWYKGGRKVPIHDSRELSSTLSVLCDECYGESPFIGNEMISYHKLSAAASRARRELVEAMATRAGEERLGMKGFPPEVALYLSLLKAQGLHKKKNKGNDTGIWYLSLDGHDPNLQCLWQRIDKCINDAESHGVTVADMLDDLYKPPFGMRQGPAPIYIALYLLVKSDEVAVFQEGKYLPYISAADMALMLKRPDLFALKECVATNVQREVFDAYRNVLNTAEIDREDGLRNPRVIGVVGPLSKFVNELPEYTQQTRKVSLEAQQARSAIANSADPVELLFRELPKALGVEPRTLNSENEEWLDILQSRLQDSLGELARAYDDLAQDVKDAVGRIVPRAFECKDLEEFYIEQRSRIKPLIEICDDNELRIVLQALSKDYDSLSDWVNSVAAIVIQKPVTSWRDNDLDMFSVRLRDYADRIEQLRHLALVYGSTIPSNARLVSLRMPDGGVRRQAVMANSTEDSEVNQVISTVVGLNLPKRDAWSIVVGLAEKLFEGDINVSRD